MKETFELQLRQVIDLLPEIIIALLVLVVFGIIGRFVSNGVGRLIGVKRAGSKKQSRLIKRLTRWGFNLLGLVIALNLVGLTKVATSFLAAGGIMAVVLGFAFREIGENLLAGVFLSFSRSFDVGDLVESNGIRGIVKRIEIRDVHIRTADGCDIFIPSSTIYKNPLYNFTRDGLRRGDFTVGIDYGDDLSKARQVLLAMVQENEVTLKDPAPNIQVAGFNPAYVELQVFFWVNTFLEGPGLAEVRSQIMNTAQKSLAENGFTFSSNVTTAIDMMPVNVRLNKENGTE